MITPLHREWIWGAFLLRFSLGMIFFFAGLNKFIGGLPQFREQITGMFAETWLPGFSVALFAHVLPFAEAGLGLLLMLGLFRLPVLYLASLLMLALAFGMLIAGNSEVMFKNFIYVALYVAAFFASPWDVLAVDTLFRRRSKDVK